MIIQGNWLSTAASSVGISHQTLDSWLRKGNEVIKIGHPQSEGDKDLADFACWVHQATAMAEERDVQRLDQFCDLDWKPLLAKMGRRYGKNWSAPATETNVNQKTEAKVEHQVTQVSLTIKDAMDLMTVEQQRAFLEKYRRLKEAASNGQVKQITEMPATNGQENGNGIELSIRGGGIQENLGSTT